MTKEIEQEQNWKFSLVTELLRLLYVENMRKKLEGVSVLCLS